MSSIRQKVTNLIQEAMMLWILSSSSRNEHYILQPNQLVHNHDEEALLERYSRCK
jgi:hypothetical protein